MNHFIIGKKNVGKSTAINRVVDSFNGKVVGFRTVVSEEIIPGTRTAHFLDVSSGEVPTKENMMFICREKDSAQIAQRFNDIGVRILEKALESAERNPAKTLIIMDEIGPAEEQAAMFHQMITRCLGCGASVLGVIQKSDSDFATFLTQRHDVKVWEINPENRKEVSQGIMNALIHTYNE